MAIPYITNVGFTDVSSSGSLNTKAGDKTKLPVQFFRLSGAIKRSFYIDADAYNVGSMARSAVEEEKLQRGRQGVNTT